jgi:steroid 5-alpha reductase family enzyme
MSTLFLQALYIIFILVTLLWVLSAIIKNVSIVDLFWGMGFVIVNAVYFYYSDDFFQRKILLLILVTLWGLRLSIYLASRNLGKGEDFRYQEFRRKYGAKRYWWVSYFQTFLLQGALIMFVSLPLLGTNSQTYSHGLNWLDYMGIVVFIIGFAFEAGGDFQLARFKKNPNNKGKVLKTGFWKYTRHPNYFGDSVVWWSFAIFAMAAGSYWTIIGSVGMTLLIIKVSGVSLLEKSLKESKPQYHDYIKKTNSFFPWFPKK